MKIKYVLNPFTGELDSTVLGGPQGDKGDKGSKGEPNGPKGEMGPKGESGKGEKGELGAGEKGDKGALGPKGELGTKGERGSKGIPGTAAAKGAKGEPGSGSSDGSAAVLIWFGPEPPPPDSSYVFWMHTVDWILMVRLPGDKTNQGVFVPCAPVCKCDGGPCAPDAVCTPIPGLPYLESDDPVAERSTHLFDACVDIPNLPNL